MRRRQYSFKIDAYTPATIPMARLADYMRELARLLGEAENVHFVKVASGSMVLVHEVEFGAVAKVEERVTDARQERGPADAIQAVKTINRMLRENNAVGTLKRHHATIIEFPGREETPTSFGLISQEGSLDGFVERVGGESDPCPVHLKSTDERTYLCDADRSIAKELAKNLFDVEIRAHGTGRWFRNDDGKWVLDRFRIRHFDLLKDLPLTAVVAELRTVPGSEWPSVKDPWHELERIRKGPETNGHK